MDTLHQASLVAAGNAEQLDAIAELVGKGNIERADMADSLDVDRAKVDAAAECETGKNGELVSSIDTIDVERRIGLGIAQSLRLRQHHVEGRTRRPHIAQHVIAGAV